MAPNPPHPTPAHTRPPPVSLVISAVLATLMVGNPFRVVQLAYLDYSHTPAGGNVPIASDTRAPLPDNPNK